ncbi:MAG: sglT 4 [Verrucomicrobia bacterium]|nr:sglT 4 [Verrucomicrobiota bacterium]
MISTYDYAIIGFYFLFLSALGWFYRHSAKDSDEYFRGGGRMPWWLVGTRSFMGSFSAWTFTGAAALAYDHGLVVLVIYLGNSLMFLSNWAWTAAKFRQLRVIIGMEALRLRLGTRNEQFFIWISYPVGWLVAGIQLYGLGIICGTMFHLDIRTIIIVCGISMIVLSTLGGAWGVATGNFLQTLILMPITLVMAVYALRLCGGVGPLLQSLPRENLDLTASHVPGFGAWFVVAVLLDKLTGANAITNAGTYLGVRDGAEARKVALLSAALFLVGSIIWFIPPLVARGQGMNLAAMLPALNNPSDGAYVAVALQQLPAGLLGLFATGMISATLATMDSSLSGSAGIITRSIYLPLLRPRASERELVLVGRIATVILGVVTILIALMYTTWRDVGIFTLMQNFSAMIGVPLTVPLFWCLWTRRAPDWVAWSTVVASLVTTLVAGPLLSLPVVRHWADGLGAAHALQLFLARDYVFLVLFNFAAGSLWYLVLGAVFRGAIGAARRAQIDDFFQRFNRPLSPQEISAEGSDTYRSAGIGKLILYFAGFIALLLFIPNRAGDRCALGFCAAFVGATGFLLYRLGRRGGRAEA